MKPRRPVAGAAGGGDGCVGCEMWAALGPAVAVVGGVVPETLRQRPSRQMLSCLDPGQLHVQKSALLWLAVAAVAGTAATGALAAWC